MIFSYSQILRILTFGVFLLMDSTRPSLLMKVFSLGLLNLALMRGFGNLGHPSVVSLCGWMHIIGAGRRIGWQGGGLPHPKQCLLCDQEEETINHLLVPCVFTRQVWFSLFQHFGIHQFSPQPTDSSFDLWWERSSNATAGLTKKGFNSLVIL